MNIDIPGNYRISRLIGSGGMGSVYLAHDLRLARDVAIKVISPQLAGKPSLMARFRVEAVAQARLNHPNIVTIHTFEHHKGTYFIVMEYVNGKTLAEILKSTPGGKLPIDQALFLFYQCLDGIAYAHQQGVLHRDIKPANIFVTPDQKVKIGDFGIARVSGFEGLTRTGAALGTLLYSSPEQIRGEKTAPPTDIYSLGITLYEMITGVQPFKNETGSDYEIQQAHLKKKPQKPSTHYPGIPPALDSAIIKSLAKSPRARYADALTFKKDLETLTVSTPHPLPSPGPILKIEKLDTARLFQTLANLKQRAVEFFQSAPSRPSSGSGPVQPSDHGSHIRHGLTEAQKRKLLLILIPLLLLLLIVIASTQERPSNSSPQGGVEARKTKLIQKNIHIILDQ